MPLRALLRRRKFLSPAADVAFSSPDDHLVRRELAKFVC